MSEVPLFDEMFSDELDLHLLLRRVRVLTVAVFSSVFISLKPTVE